MRVSVNSCSITITVPFVIFAFSSILLANGEQAFLEGQGFGNLKSLAVIDAIESMEINEMNKEQVNNYYSELKAKPAASTYGSGSPGYSTQINSDHDFDKVIATSSTIKAEKISGICSSGDCVIEEQVSDLKPEEALSNIAAINDAKSSLSNALVFSGDLMKCRKIFAGFRNCCANSGWGKKIGSECSNEEKNLANLVETKWCHYLGEYCAKKSKITNTCIERKKSYCCYNSMLSRIVQDNAHTQLNISWLSPKKEKCLGISADTLSKIDFSKINFSEYYAKLNSDVNQKSNQIKQALNNFASNIQVPE